MSPVQNAESTLYRAKLGSDAVNLAVDGLRQDMERSAGQLMDLKERLDNVETRYCIISFYLWWNHNNVIILNHFNETNIIFRRAVDQDATEQKLDSIKELI